ncbi:hypothetical protein ACF1FX_00380 [Streptomyces sp. NPDC014646]|uniref:hypothetical protein n=1 Tax=Streptomyces sp. NPDC014646 TaxID=3364877 RepID=UPI0036FE0E56
MGFVVRPVRGSTWRRTRTGEATAIVPSPSVIAAVDGSYDRIVGINEPSLQAPSRPPRSSCSALLRWTGTTTPAYRA